jgi:hypothetical protein
MTIRQYPNTKAQQYENSTQQNNMIIQQYHNTTTQQYDNTICIVKLICHNMYVHSFAWYCLPATYTWRYTHEARNSDPDYLITWNPFTPLLGRKWTYVAMIHS